MAFDADHFRTHSVRLRGVKDIEEIRAWCRDNIPVADEIPILSAHEQTTGAGGWVVRAMFKSQHYAALFRMWWDGSN